MDGVRTLTLTFSSQEWRGIAWAHSLLIFIPRSLRYPSTCFLYVTGDESPGDTALTAALACELDAPVAVLHDVPNQPLFNGKSEDELIAHTFEQFLETGEEDWPLLLPMTRAACRAMDAVQELSTREWGSAVDRFVVSGASKRGWTTWLTAAADPRVMAIAPLVFDNLHFEAQMPRQRELWGGYSAQIDAYSQRDLQSRMNSQAGQRLIALVDPWHQRDRLTMPKLLIHGANDPYWATDATRIYWDHLPGANSLLQVPNAGHALQQEPRVRTTLAAFFHSVAAGQSFPLLRHRYERRECEIRMQVTASTQPRSIRAWVASSDTLDFRAALWVPSDMPVQGSTASLSLPTPKIGGLAWFAEAEFEWRGRQFTLSTPPAVHPIEPPASDPRGR